MKKGILTIISGFSGAGKGTIIRELLKRYENYSLSISATTRAPREGEVEGESYFFKTEEEFSKMIMNDEFIEYTNYVGNYYGTPKSSVFEKLENGEDVVLEIEIQGALNVKKKYPETMLIFISPPSASVLKDRLFKRGTETDEQIEKRLKKAVEEADRMRLYDYIVVNDDLDVAIDQMHALIQSQKHKIIYNEDVIKDITLDMRKKFLEKNF